MHVLAWVGFILLLVITLGPLVICVLKGKYGFALFGVLISALWWIGAIRLAKPTSLWARRWYGEAKLAQAEQRYDRFAPD